MQSWTMWVFLGVLVVLLGGMWFMNNRRYKKQQKDREERMSALAVGDRIVTIGMLVGEIVEKNEDGTFVLKTGSAENVGYITIQEAAIYQIIKKEEPIFEEPTEEPEPVTEEPAEEPAEEKNEE